MFENIFPLNLKSYLIQHVSKETDEKMSETIAKLRMQNLEWYKLYITVYNDSVHRSIQINLIKVCDSIWFILCFTFWNIQFDTQHQWEPLRTGWNIVKSIRELILVHNIAIAALYFESTGAPIVVWMNKNKMKFIIKNAIAKY